MKVNAKGTVLCEVCGDPSGEYARGNPDWSEYPVPLCAGHNVLWSRYAALNLEYELWRLVSIEAQLDAFRETGVLDEASMKDTQYHNPTLQGITIALAGLRRKVVQRMLAWAKRQRVKEAKP